MTLPITLDSWAVLAWLGGEPGGDVVRDILQWASHSEASMPESLAACLPPGYAHPEVFINLVNWGEVLYILTRNLGQDTALGHIGQIHYLPITVLPADEKTVFAAALVKAQNRVSYADAFAIASARLTEGILVTGDPEIRNVPNVRLCYLGK